nr:MAG TPA: hypothetical protein [Caudoviricetes sp.]
MWEFCICAFDIGRNKCRVFGGDCLTFLYRSVYR